MAGRKTKSALLNSAIDALFYIVLLPVVSACYCITFELCSVHCATDKRLQAVAMGAAVVRTVGSDLSDVICSLKICWIKKYVYNSM